jgi:hypothetical protein
MRTLLALLLASAALAGCVTADPPTTGQGGSFGRPDYDAIERAIGEPVTDDHDHLDPALHASSHNLRLVAQLRGEPGRSPQPSEGYMETAVKGGYAYLTRTGPDQGLVIFDVRDIENPRFVSYLHLDSGYEPDVEVSDDGNWVFWETQRYPTSIALPDPTQPGTDLPRGIHIVDVSDKANPRWAGFQPVLVDGPHSITYANITGRHIVFASAYSYAYVRQGVYVPTAQRAIIYELDASGPVAQLRELYTYEDPAAQQDSLTGRAGMFPHDVSVAWHPLAKRTFAYIAYWDLGVVILDVTDPAHPVKVGQAIDFGPAPTREIHMARQSPDLIDGKVVLVAEPEIDGQPTTGYMAIIDVSDPARPQWLSSWKIPGNSTSMGGGLGPHYFDIRDGRVAMASYHAGFWVFDIHDAANLLRPRTVAYALVNATGNSPLPSPFNLFGQAANAFDAWWADATHVVAGDVHGGLSVFRYEGPTPPAKA